MWGILFIGLILVGRPSLPTMGLEFRLNKKEKVSWVLVVIASWLQTQNNQLPQTSAFMTSPRGKIMNIISTGVSLYTIHLLYLSVFFLHEFICTTCMQETEKCFWTLLPGVTGCCELYCVCRELNKFLCKISKCA